MQPPSDTAPKPYPVAGLTGSFTVPGDRSISHLALMLGALTAGSTTITGLLEAPDVLRTAAAMRALGAGVEKAPDGSWRVAGRGIGGLVEPSEVLDLGEAAAAAPLLLGLLAGHPMLAVVTGDATLRQQPMPEVPMRWVTDALAGTGARFASRAGGCLPLVVEGVAEPLPLDVALPTASAEWKAACLLAGLCARGTTRVREPAGSPDHTEHLLRHFGATVRVSPDGPGSLVELDGQPELVAAAVAVPGDSFAAAVLVVAALLVPGSAITLRDVCLSPQHAGLFQALREMGAEIIQHTPRQHGGAQRVDLQARASALHGLGVPAGRAADAAALLATAAGCARGTTRLGGLGGASAIAAMLAAAGIRHEVEGNDLLVHGGGVPPEGGGLVETRMDHRIALSALVLGLVTRRPMRIDDGACIEAAFPGLAGLIDTLAGRA